MTMCNSKDLNMRAVFANDDLIEACDGAARDLKFQNPPKPGEAPLTAAPTLGLPKTETLKWDVIGLPPGHSKAFNPA